MEKQRGFGVVEGLLILAIAGILGGIGWYVYTFNTNTSKNLRSAATSGYKSSSSNNQAPSKTCTLPVGWKEFINTEYKYSHYYPSSYKVALKEELAGNYGDYVTGPNDSNNNIFVLSVLKWPSGTTIGNADGGVDVFIKAMNEGGIKSVAQLSQKINKEVNNPYIQNNSIGEVRSFNVCSGEAWGFTVTKAFSSGFTLRDQSGQIVDNETAFVYVGNKTSVYLVEYAANNAVAAKILSSLKLP